MATDDRKIYRDKILPQLRDLTDRIQLLSWALQQNFIDNYVHFTPTKSLEHLNYKHRKENIEYEYSKLSEEIKKFQEKFEMDDEFTSLWNKIETSYATFNNLCLVVVGKNILQQADHEFGRYNYSDAMISIKKLQKQLQGIKFEGNLKMALINLLGQSQNQLALYTAHLSLEWEDIFSWSENKSLHCLTYSLTIQQSDPILIQKLLKTLYLTERLNAELASFSDFFVNKLLHNVIQHNCDIFTDDHIGALVFNIKINLNDTKKPNYQTIFNNLTAVFEFLHSTLSVQFENDPKFIEIFSESIRGKFFSKIIEDCIRNNLPTCDSSYQNYRNIVAELESFNKFLIDLKFVKADESPLNKYIDDTECVLYNKKCDKLLHDVRNILCESICHGTTVVGTDNDNNENKLETDDAMWNLNNLLFLPKCVISQNVKKIMSLIVEYLEESTKLPEKYSNMLVSYIKDIAVMYQSIVPKKFKINLEYCPLDIALFFNNCFYLAHGLLGPPWKNILPASLADQLSIVLLECIQDLRVLGLEKLSLYLQTQKNLIIQNIECKDSTSWTQDTFEHFDSAVNKALTLLRDLKTSWRNILPKRMYEMSVSTLCQTLCETVLERIFANTQHIDEELVYKLAIKLEDTAEEISTLFEDSFKIEAKIISWLKFIKMPQLLKAQMLEIANLWTEKRDTLQSYSCEEIRQIVKMRFPDDKYRLKILKEIQ